MAWLDGSWAHLESTRRQLRAQALVALGRTGEAAVERQQIFEASLAVWDLHAWLDLLPPHEQATAIERSRKLAEAHADPIVVALLLMDIGDDSGPRWHSRAIPPPSRWTRLRNTGSLGRGPGA